MTTTVRPRRWRQWFRWPNVAAFMVCAVPGCGLSFRDPAHSSANLAAHPYTRGVDRTRLPDGGVDG